MGRKNGNMLSPVTKHRSRLLGKVEKTLLFLARPGWVVVLWCQVLKDIAKPTPLCNRMPCSSPVSPQDCCGKTFLFGGYHKFGAIWFLGFLSNHVPQEWSWAGRCWHGQGTQGVVMPPLDQPLTLCVSLPRPLAFCVGWEQPGLWSTVSLLCNGEVAVI